MNPNTEIKKDLKHIYIFDYSCGKIYHDRIEQDKDWEEYLAENNFNMDEVYCMITNNAICIEEITTNNDK